MALNYSHRPVFPAHTSAKTLWSPLRTVNGCLAEGSPEVYGECYLRPWHPSQEEMGEWDFISQDTVGRCCSPESNSRDIADRLPSDPFGMDIQTTFTALTGWLEDLEVDYGAYTRSNSQRSDQENYNLFAGCCMLYNNALNSQPQPFSSGVQSNEDVNYSILPLSSSPQVYVKPDETLDAINNVDTEMENSLDSYNNEFPPAYEESWMMDFSNEGTSYSPELQFGEKVEGAAKSDEAPHDAFKFCLMYLGVKDLLSMETVCSYFRSEVRGEPLLWKSIHIEPPLNEKITDDILLELACRADGTLQSLSLVECLKITDDGIKRVLETNPWLTKLFVPGCTRLTVEGMLKNVWTYNSNKDAPGIKFLRIGGLYGVTHEHFEELKSLLGTDDNTLKSHHKPHIYHRGNYYLPYDDDRAIDIEMCPRCEKFKLVYDCPSEGCQVKDNGSQVCRACTLCITRCSQCGTCINDNEYEETFCLDLVCSDCFEQLVKYQDGLNEKADPCGDHMSMVA
ncbi:F-box protein SKIP14-like [Salvia splendens]|uniref:F-box protein SKIP14-like n=1 Tax=Salvia splendens TaxID=180675 RepID=UPI001C2803C7|nr:F-box protein SKIP14-like [Salvia splendens]